MAPMLGLLGTTLGMITTFHEISGKGAGGSSQLGLAQGVSEALLCTASGLVIGIPALIFYCHLPREGEPSDLRDGSSDNAPDGAARGAVQTCRTCGGRPVRLKRRISERRT
jgi:hypothetical protein